MNVLILGSGGRDILHGKFLSQVWVKTNCPGNLNRHRS